jgi:acetyl esterase/lipase
VADAGTSVTPQQQASLDFLGPRTMEISPVHHLARNLPPTVIFHGKQDPLMPFTAVEDFCTKARDRRPRPRFAILTVRVKA